MRNIKKIVIIGGESTGKSTLCEHLAMHYKTSWVKEFAREYLETLGRDYVETNLLEIAKGQLALEKKIGTAANQFLFCDTDLHVIKVWSDYKYGRCDSFILHKIAKQKQDAYIITSPDFPWKEDPLREHPEPKLREYFFELYKAIVLKTGLPYCIVSGNEVERMKKATFFLDDLY